MSICRPDELIRAHRLDLEAAGLAIELGDLSDFLDRVLVEFQVLALLQGYYVV